VGWPIDRSSSVIKKTSPKTYGSQSVYLVMETTTPVEKRMSYSFVQVKYMSPSVREAKIKTQLDSIRNG
jgi:hypothetical protein